MDETGLREACGVFGCVASGPWPSQLDVASIIATGLMGLQHRGQESAGIVTGLGTDKLTIQKGMGLINQVFSDDRLTILKGNLGIGHTRYSTAGCSSLLNCQPFVVETLHGRIAVAHNGELVNANRLKQHLLRHGTGLSTASDSELITQLLSHSPPEAEPNGPDWPARIKQLMSYTLTSYSFLVLHEDVIYAVRDPFGNRPLCFGKLLPVRPLTNDNENNAEGEKKSDEVADEEGWVVSSESCSFQSIGAKYYREVLPGEIVELSRGGIRSLDVVPRPDSVPPAFCLFEYVYFSRPDSILEGQMVYSVRERCGRRLAIEAKVDADIVSTVPESATPAALGYSAESGLPYAEVLCKNRYVGRTFIQPSSHLRQLGVAMKFGVLYENIVGKRIVLIDDSIVRGNTMGPIVKLLKASGASEVHIRVASPPLKYPCYMGINIPTHQELIANKMDLQQLAQHLGANSVVYLSLDGLLEAIRSKITKKTETGQCTACLTGNYPVSIDW